MHAACIDFRQYVFDLIISSLSAELEVFQFFMSMGHGTSGYASDCFVVSRSVVAVTPLIGLGKAGMRKLLPFDMRLVITSKRMINVRIYNIKSGNQISRAIKLR